MKTIEVEQIKKTDTKVSTTQITEIKGSNGWKRISSYQLNNITRIIYLGKCLQDGDTFAIYWNNFISLAKGKLNNGKFLIQNN